MQLKRYSTQELQNLCTDIFYDHMSSVNNDSYDCPTPAHVTHKEYKDNLAEYNNALKRYSEIFATTESDKVKRSVQKEITFLRKGADYIATSNMVNQKELFKATGTCDFCRTTVRIPLDKKINSYYDDFTLEVVFYDDVCTLNGKFEQYKKLKTKKDRRNFLLENTEITHLGLLYIRENRLISIIELKGTLNYGDPRVVGSGVVLLGQKFSDFNKLTLKDTSEIDNNDLKQFIQSKIDLDKEDMEELSSKVIRGDRYSIHKSTNTMNGKHDLYIRYTCRGTSRIYYNRLNLNNLKLSSYFEENNYDTYSKAWWDLNTLGGNPENEKPVIRC